MMRIIAAFFLLLPGVIAAFGIKLMRDTLFDDFYSILLTKGIQFIVGLLLFIGGVAFLGGYIYHRDQKKQRIKQYNNKEKTYNNQ